MRTMKPILGQKDVVIKEATKKGTEERFTITLEMQVVDSERTFKDVLFYDETNEARSKVLPAIISALAEQTGLAREEYITEDGEELIWDLDKVLTHIKGKNITVVRSAVVSERNGQTYYNISYKPETIIEEEVEL